MTYKQKLADPRWQKKRLEIFERDDWKCTECGRDYLELHIHHDEYTEIKPWDEPNENLRTVCYKCHACLSTGIDFSLVKAEIRKKYL